jgi:5'-nucleotidase/UDP-sugar diphosphatase
MVKNPSGVDVPIVQAYAYSKYLGEVKVTFDDDGNVISAEGEPHLLDASVTPDEGFAARVKELGAPIEELKTKVVSESTDTIEGSRDVCRAMRMRHGQSRGRRDARPHREPGRFARDPEWRRLALRSTPARSPWAKC